jgi:hypothetical protein
MTINLNIARLVLKDDLLDRRQGPLLGRALEAELTRLLAEQRRSARLLSGGAVRILRTDPVKPNPNAGPAEWGTQIARAVYEAITGSEPNVVAGREGART